MDKDFKPYWQRKNYFGQVAKSLDIKSGGLLTKLVTERKKGYKAKFLDMVLQSGAVYVSIVDIKDEKHFTAVSDKVVRDLKNFVPGFSVSKTLVKQRKRALLKNGNMVIVEQGFCKRVKEGEGKGKILAAKATTYKATDKAKNFIASITNLAYAGIKEIIKVGKQFIGKVDGFTKIFQEKYIYSMFESRFQDRFTMLTDTEKLEFITSNGYTLKATV